MRGTQILIAVLVLIPVGVAKGQDPSAPPPLQSSVAVSEGGMLGPPAEVRGYHLTDSIHMNLGGRAVVQYTYAHESDTATVYIMTYVGEPPATPHAAAAVVQEDVERIRQTYYGMATTGDTLSYRVVGDRPEVIDLNGQPIQYYWTQAWLGRAGQAAKYVYYATYALPLRMVRIRGQAPTYETNLHEQLAAFGHDLMAAMIPPSATAGGSSAGLRSAAMPAACTAMPPATDTINYHVVATLEAPARTDPLPSSYVELVLDALRHGLVVPNPLGLTVYTAMVSSQGAVMVPAVYGEIEFTLDREGKMLDAHLTQSSMSPALDRSFYDAARRADSMQAFPAQIGVPNPGSIRFYVSFSPFDTHAAQSMPFFAVRMPAWKPAARPGINAARDMKPVFPVAARNAAVGDSVTIQFVVDEHGAPVKSTMRLLSAAHIEYAQSVVDAALGSQYVPAVAAGCPVNALLERSWKMSVQQ